MGVASVPCSAREGRRVSLYPQLRAEDTPGIGKEFMEGTDACAHTQATPSMHHTHPHPQIDVVTFSLPSLDNVRHSQIDDSKDFDASKSRGQKQETVLLSTSWLCTWTCLYFLTDRSRWISVCGQNSWDTSSCTTT